jgi:hypothetical protein
MSQGLIMIGAVFCLLGEERKEKKKRKERARVFFSPGLEAGPALLAVPGRIFVAVRCN